MNEQNWLSTNEIQEAVSSLQMASEQIVKVGSDKYRWKWVVIALHNAVQGFMVLALKGTNSLNVMREADAEKWLHAWDNQESSLPSTQLDNFLNLYRKVKGDRMLMRVNSKKFTPSGQQGRSIKKLNELRNEFIHFEPKSFLLEISGLPNICYDCVQIIRFLGWESGNIHWDKEESLEQPALDSLGSLERVLQELDSAYKTDRK